MPSGRRREDAVASPVMTLVLGGARSGKSAFAERLAGDVGGTVRYVATGGLREDDAVWMARVAAHRVRRPAAWTTVELAAPAELAAALDTVEPVLVDSLGTWLATVDAFGEPIGSSTETLAVLDALGTRRSRGLPTVLVSDEVGLGVHPFTPSGRAFRDALGAFNTQVATEADEVLMVVAGRVVTLGAAVGDWRREA
jgi:adenosylcobinamide kinase / adenosylcobinamide-phosphate guanylyltransferase